MFESAYCTPIRAPTVLCPTIVGGYTARHIHFKEPSSVNRPDPLKNDNFFIALFTAISKRRIPIALRLACHSVVLVGLAMIIYAGVMGFQFRSAMQQHADALGQSLVLQTRESAAQLLVANDMLSLNVLLNNLVKNKLVAHAAVYSMGSDGRILAEAGERPIPGLLGHNQGLYSSDITFQEVIAGHLRITLDTEQFQQPMTISLQSMVLLGGIMLALALYMSVRLARDLTYPLKQLRLWLRDPDEQAPATDRQDEIGDIARQLQNRLAKASSVSASQEKDFTKSIIEPIIRPQPKAPLQTRQEPRIGPEPEISFSALEEDNPFEQGTQTIQPTVFEAPQEPVKAPLLTAVLAVQLGAQEQLRRLPKTRLMELLQRYRDCIEQAANFYEAELHTPKDGSSLMLFHQSETQDYLTHAICCGELLRALGHQLQVEVADSGITLQLQLAMSQGAGLEGLNQGDILLSDQAQAALALSQHSRNLLLLESSVSQTRFMQEHARIRTLVSPEGASCVERLLEPYPSLVERQLVLMHERATTV